MVPLVHVLPVHFPYLTDYINIIVHCPSSNLDNDVYGYDLIKYYKRSMSF